MTQPHRKLAVFDFDSTLAQGETIDELGAAYGVKDKVSIITNRAMCFNLKLPPIYFILIL